MAGVKGMKGGKHRDDCIPAVVSAEKREIFLNELCRTGHPKESALKAGFADSTFLYRLRKNDPEFAAQWKEALDIFLEEVLEPEVMRRAFYGVEKPQWFKGEIVGYELQYSDNMAMFMLKALNPKKYRESVEVHGEVSHKVGVALLPITATLVEDWERSAAEVSLKQQILRGPSEKEIIDVPHTTVSVRRS